MSELYKIMIKLSIDELVNHLSFLSERAKLCSEEELVKLDEAIMELNHKIVNTLSGRRI